MSCWRFIQQCRYSHCAEISCVATHGMMRHTLALDYGPLWNGFFIRLSRSTQHVERHAGVGETNWLDGTQFPGPGSLGWERDIRLSEGWSWVNSWSPNRLAWALSHMPLIPPPCFVFHHMLAPEHPAGGTSAASPTLFDPLRLQIAEIGNPCINITVSYSRWWYQPVSISCSVQVIFKAWNCDVVKDAAGFIWRFLNVSMVAEFSPFLHNGCLLQVKLLTSREECHFRAYWMKVLFALGCQRWRYHGNRFYVYQSLAVWQVKRLLYVQ